MSEPDRPFRAGPDDAVILPLVVIVLVAKTLVRWAWRLLVFILDLTFPILLQIARFLLFTFRILGDGITALLRFVIKILPLPNMRRQKWRDAIGRSWSWLRRKVSYRAFEEFVHHLFEDGMAWVFKTCRRLSPGGALFVIVAALIWMPVSFVAATAVHTYLITEAATLPSWMQVFHAVAAILAKSKLLMLPAYPAAWPQAKKHPWVQAAARVYRFVANLRVVRKARYRFGQTEDAATRAVTATGNTAPALGVVRVLRALGTKISDGAARIGAALRALLLRVTRRLSRFPILGSVLRSYAAHYDRSGDAPAPRLSERVRSLFKRWEIKFTPAYYEEKERADAAKHP